MTKPTIGVIGLGIMGAPMAENLLEAGYDVIGYNRSTEAVDRLVAAGGTGAATAAEAAAGVDVLITCLPDSPVVSDVMRGEDGVIDGIESGSIVIDMSTISPTVTEDLAAELGERDVDMLDAPISGGEEGAIEGSLSIMVGGEAEVLASVRPILDVLGETVTHCGGHGAGQVAKACNQIVVANTMAAVSEALLFAEKAGADLEAVVEAISGGAAGCWTLDHRAPRMIRGNFEPGFFAEYQYKDLRIATRAGQEYGAPMPTTAGTHELYKSTVESGHGRDDTSGVLQVLEAMAGTTARIDE